ncbi:TonB-dependent receptor [Pseudomaricurvus hydrocarbonicus]
MAIEAGLRRLLSQSELTFEMVSDQSFIIVPVAEAGASAVVGVGPGRQRATIEEITVTATKRETRLQDTPLAITALDQHVLHEHRVSSLFDFMALVPSLQVARRGDHSASMLYLRGVGSDNPTEAGDSGVATHVDGIYSSRSQGAAVLLYDLAQIEVLRGPQGSLFGRNSTSGVVNYHTNAPAQEFESRLELAMGNYQYQSARGVLNVPVTDSWAIRLAGALEKQDGQLDFARGSVSNREADQYNNLDHDSVRLSSSWKINEAVNWWLSYERFNDHSSGNLPAVDYDEPVLIDSLGVTDLEMTSVRSRLDFHVNEALHVAYIAGYTSMDRTQNWDGDGVSPLGSETNPLQYHQNNQTVWSDYYSRQHEIQFKGGDGQRFQWLLAYFSFEEETDIRFDLEHQDATGSGWGGAASHSFQQPHRGSRFAAAYGQVSYDFTDRWGAAMGARTGRDQRYDKGGRNVGCPDLIRADRHGDLGDIAVNRESASDGQCFVSSYNDVDQAWGSTTYMARLEYRPTDDILLYWMYAEGFKPGIVEDGNSLKGLFSGPDDPGFQTALMETIAINNGDQGNAAAYIEPEQSRNLEFGFKLTLLQNAVTLNGALFKTAYDDLQVSSVAIDAVGSEVFRSSNAASATINGLELELNWATSLHGQLSGQLSFLDARYDKFLAIDSSFPQYGQTWNPSAHDPSVPDLVDYSGNQMKQAPRFRFSVAYKHHFRLSSGAHLTPSVLLTYSDKVYFSEANREHRSGQLLDNRTGQWVADPSGAASHIDVQPAYWMVNARFKFEPLKGPWWLEGYVENLTDEQVAYDVFGIEAAQPRFYLAAPRTLGVRVGFRFH